MLHRRNQKEGQSLIEYSMLIVFILTAFLVFQKYIARGIYGRWKAAGDGMGYGRLYDPKKTLECIYYASGNIWYDRKCYDQQSCDCYSILATTITCDYCIQGCSPQKCKE
ncbi:hypothetical protein MNBD_UNCLBAC01-1585 [hydrothermal vent metagenome]|uniref:Uncharacterized protein n=1 Tax=hydrothermal vent metagenome TaxID=652676 RepID=A0A3B1DQ77_9ZZZZ